MNTKVKGNKAEGIILSQFLRYDIPVLLPFGDNEKYDLVIDINDEFKSVQVKHGRYRNGCVISDIRHRIGKNRIDYETYNGKVDYIAIWCSEIDECYIIDLKEFQNTEVRLRVEDAKKNHPSINWADEYLLKEFLK